MRVPESIGEVSQNEKPDGERRNGFGYPKTNGKEQKEKRIDLRIRELRFAQKQGQPQSYSKRSDKIIQGFPAALFLFFVYSTIHCRRFYWPKTVLNPGQKLPSKPAD